MDNPVIRITRGKDYFGMVRKLNIYLDGEYAGSVERNDSTDLHVSPGSHQLYVKMDWCKSQPVITELEDTDFVEFLAIPPGNNSITQIFRPLFHMIFNFSTFFELKKLQEN